MRNVDDAEDVGALAEPLDDKAEDAVGEHVDRIDSAVKAAFHHLAVKDNQQHYIKEHFRATRRPSIAGRADRQAETAAVDETIEPRAEQREDQRKAEDIEHHLHVAPEKLRTEEVEQRHEEYSAVQAEIARFAGTDQTFEFCEQLDAYDADDGMQDRQNQRSVPLCPQILLEHRQPDK